MSRSRDPSPSPSPSRLPSRSPSRSPFDALVEDYDAARPSYPEQMYEALERLGTRPLAGADVVEVGAGTGIATRALLGRGARVVALDLGPVMLRRLQRHSPAVPAVVADAHALPLHDGIADIVCFAQAWHWVRVAEAAAEVVRVLRPGGALAVWWNDVAADDQPWWQAQQERLEAGNPAYSRDYRSRQYGDALAETGLFGSVDYAECDWVRPLGLEDYVAWLRSKSYVAGLGDGLGGFLAAERSSLAAAFPDGVVREPFRTRLWLARAS